MNRPVRGYALMFVIGVTIALGVVVGGLFAFLAESVSSSRQAQEELQQLYGCDGALRLAMFEAGKSGANADIAKLQENLGILSAALQTDINPRTGRPFADLEGIRVERESVQVQQATNAPFFGMQFVQEGSEFIVEANADLSRGRTCRAQSPNRLRTISYFQFALVSNDILLGRPSGIGSALDVTAGTTGDVYTLQHSSGSRGGLRQRRTFTERGAFAVQDIHIADQETFRPVPPSGQPWSFINKKKRFFGGTKRRTRHKRPQLEYFVKYPTNSPGIDPTLSRFAMQADIRIIDGEWYVPDAFGSYPGNKLWSDRPGSTGREVDGAFTYSAYETDDGKARGGAAIVRYGLVGRHNDALVPMAPGVCASAPAELAPVVQNDDGDIEIVCGGIPTAPPDDVDPLLVAAREGFLDPFKRDDGTRTPILPIVLDVRALAAAMLAEGTGDLGDARCLHDDVVRCPEQRRFRGAVWVGTLPAGIFDNGTPRDPASAPGGVLPDGTARRPCPLEAASATGCARPNAVVIVNADNLEAFSRTGLSIGSNLPMYVVGHVNSATPELRRTSRVALLAPTITGLAPDFDMATVAWSRGESATLAAANVTLDWRASLFTSWASSRQDLRDPERHILRRLQDDLRIDVTGSVVAMFRRQDYDKIQVFNSSKGSFSSPRPDPLIAGLPMFVADVRNPEEEASRLARGRVRFPGEEVRDLRRADLEHQPPAAPRFSIDPAPIDRR
jgi:hypothetical protein